MRALLLGLAGCLSTEAPAALVPPTADEDPALPQIAVEVAGRRRALHLEEHGDPSAPALLVMPGGPGADFRMLLPLAELADEWHVVLWDPRGAGLSERVDGDELAIERFLDEIDAVRDAVVPGEPVVLAGHSYGGKLVLRYAAERPDGVRALVLLDPGALTPEAEASYEGGGISFLDGQDFFWTNEVLSSRDHAAADFKAVALLPFASRSFTCDGEPPDYTMWRFGAYHHDRVAHFEGAGVEWARGLGQLPVEVVLGTCGAASESFVDEDQAAALPDPTVDVVDGAGHLSLFDPPFADETVARVRAFLATLPR